MKCVLCTTLWDIHTWGWEQQGGKEIDGLIDGFFDYNIFHRIFKVTIVLNKANRTNFAEDFQSQWPKNFNYVDFCAFENFDCMFLEKPNKFTFKNLLHPENKVMKNWTQRKIQSFSATKNFPIKYWKFSPFSNIQFFITFNLTIGFIFSKLIFAKKILLNFSIHHIWATTVSSNIQMLCCKIFLATIFQFFRCWKKVVFFAWKERKIGKFLPGSQMETECELLRKWIDCWVVLF